MKINVEYSQNYQVLNVRRLGILEGLAVNFINGLHFAQTLDRVLLDRGKIVWVGGKEVNGYPGQVEYINMEDQRADLIETMKGF